MRGEQDYFSRTISSEGGTVYVRLRPLGSELRDLTERGNTVSWFSILPGLISIAGWIAHHTAFRSGWRVTAEPDDAIGSVALELDPLPKRDAERTFLRLVQWLQDGHPLSEFASRSA